MEIFTDISYQMLQYLYISRESSNFSTFLLYDLRYHLKEFIFESM